MEYVCTKSRFIFFNGQKNMTLEFVYGLMTWYVFDGLETSNSLWSKKIDPRKSKTPTRDEAEFILNEYLETITA